MDFDSIEEEYICDHCGCYFDSNGHCYCDDNSDFYHPICNHCGWELDAAGQCGCGDDNALDK